MGSKYTINFTKNGLCMVSQRSTNSLIIALWYFITLLRKFPIIDFEVRRGYIECKNCDADRWCRQSPKCEAEEGAKDESN